VILLGSDGSQMEGDNAEAARLTVGKQLNVKVLVDDNNVTIAGHPQEYMTGYDSPAPCPGMASSPRPRWVRIWTPCISICACVSRPDSHALVIKRPMAPGIKGAEGSPKRP